VIDSDSDGYELEGLDELEETDFCLLSKKLLFQNHNQSKKLLLQNHNQSKKLLLQNHNQSNKLLFQNHNQSKKLLFQNHNQSKKLLLQNHNQREGRKENVKLLKSLQIKIQDGKKIFVSQINLHFLGSRD
jgi:hypothetical protein